MNRRDVLAEDLLRIRKHMLEDFIFWMSKDSDRDGDVSLLKEIKNGHSYPSLQKKASELLDVFTHHLEFIAALKAGDPVQVMQTFDKVLKGSTGRYICKLTPKLSFLELDTEPIQKVSTLTLLLFPLEQEEIQAALRASSIDSIDDVSEITPPSLASPVSDTHQVVQQLLMEPNPPIPERKPPMSRTKGALGKKTIAKRNKTHPLQQATPVAATEPKPKRKYTKHTKPAEEQELELQQPNTELEEQIPEVEKMDVVADQTPASVEQSAVEEKPVIVEVVDAEKTAKEPSKAIMIYRADYQEELFLIRNPLAFISGFLFAKNIKGKRQIYVTTRVSQRIGDKKILLACSTLGDSGQVWIPIGLITYEQPHIFMKEEDKFFYLTPTEYKQVYMTSCLVELPVTIHSIDEVLTMHALFQDRIVELLKMYADQHRGFSMKNEVLAVFARLAKHNQLDFRQFESIIQIVFSDNPSELENILQQFKTYLGKDVVDDHQSQSTILSNVTDRIRSQELAAQMKSRMYNLTDHLENLSEAQLHQLEELLQKVDFSKETP